MGKKNINNAKRYTIAGGALFFAVAIIVILLLWFMREIWAKFYAPTNDNVK
jgi:Na+-driven multidrug efflux pump